MTYSTINNVESWATDDWWSSPCLRSAFHRIQLAVVMFFFYKCELAEDKVRYRQSKKKVSSFSKTESAYIFMKNMQKNSSSVEGSQD